LEPRLGRKVREKNCDKRGEVMYVKIGGCVEKQGEFMDMLRVT